MVPRHHLLHGSTNSNNARPKTPLQTPWWLSSAGRGGQGGRVAKAPSRCNTDDSQRISSSSPSCHAATPTASDSDKNGTSTDTNIIRQSLPGRHIPPAIHALGPTALLGGTAAAVYSAVYHHPACTLSPLSAFYLLLLALQTCIQPRLSRKYIKHSHNKQAVALTEEVVKTILAAGLFCSQESTVISNSMADWSIASSLAVAGIPSVLYAAQGVLTYTSHQHLNAVTFNGLSQTKTVSAAIWCYLLLGKTQSRIQMLSIGILFLSALIFQGLIIVQPPRPKEQQEQQQHASSSSTSSADCTSKDVSTSMMKDTATREGSTTWFAKGVLPCLGATFLSGLAGAFSQRGLQIVGGTGRNAFLFTIEVSFFSALSLVISMAVNRYRNSNKNDQNKTATASPSFSWKQLFSNKNGDDMFQALIPITVKAMGGILTALVHKHAGSVLKGFALVLGLVLSGLLQTVMDEENLTIHQGLGTLLVLLSSWMHFTNPPTTATSS